MDTCVTSRKIMLVTTTVVTSNQAVCCHKLQKGIKVAAKTLVEVKKLFPDDEVYEVDTGFLINQYGKYKPQITFVLPKEFDGDPLEYRYDGLYHEDRPVAWLFKHMSIEFSRRENIGILFGEYWKSPKGTECFRPLPVGEAKHLIIRNMWGGGSKDKLSLFQFMGTGVLYHQRSGSRHGGMGRDYLVVPIGYKTREASDGKGRLNTDFKVRAQEVRAHFAEYMEKQKQVVVVPAIRAATTDELAALKARFKS